MRCTAIVRLSKPSDEEKMEITKLLVNNTITKRLSIQQSSNRKCHNLKMILYFFISQFICRCSFAFSNKSAIQYLIIKQK